MLIYTLPIIAAFTGWLTNFIAVKMLFHPREVKDFKIFKLQGIFPKRQKKLAEKLGLLVANELFSVDDVKKSLGDNQKITQAAEARVEEKVDAFLSKFLGENPMLGTFLKEPILERIKQSIQTEVVSLIPEFMDMFTTKIEQDVDVEKIVYEKVSAFSSDKIEEMLFSIMKKEFKFIEIFGGILGFLIGLIQLGLLRITTL